MKKNTTVLIYFLLTSSLLFSQEKSLKKKNASMGIQKYVEVNYPEAKHIKYYQEQEQENIFIEVEFKYKKVEYSLKFLNDSLVELEINLSFGKIPANLQETIKSNLLSLFENYKILSFQEINPNANSIYEINLRTKTGNFFELYFDKSGRLIKKSEKFIKPISSQF